MPIPTLPPAQSSECSPSPSLGTSRAGHPNPPGQPLQCLGEAPECAGKSRIPWNSALSGADPIWGRGGGAGLGEAAREELWDVPEAPLAWDRAGSIPTLTFCSMGRSQAQFLPLDPSWGRSLLSCPVPSLQSSGLQVLELQVQGSGSHRTRLHRCLRAPKSLTRALYDGLKEPGKSVSGQSLGTMHLPAAHGAN